MANYIRYADVCGIKQKDMIEVIQKEYPHFGAAQMSMAFNPERNALELIPEAEELLEKAFGRGPGLSISPRLGIRNHENKRKPNRLCVRLDDALRSRVETVYKQMCFVSMQDFIEAAIAAFVDKYERKDA